MPDNFIDTYRVTISGASSTVNLDMDAAVDNLNLSGAKLNINERNLEFEDGGGLSSSI